jgi:alpha-L-fucosidase
MFNLTNLVTIALSFLRFFALIAKGAIRGETTVKIPENRDWSQRPGLSIMYQIETRPGWEWDRDFDAFNKSMSDTEGKFVFNGPYCKMDEWVQLSQEIGLDYHVFEVKWHDGICWFNTDTTDWKSPHDYTKDFSDLSRKAGIPFMFYYSSIFDHNPQFDSIQPVRTALPSLIGNKPEYIEYLKKHYAELVDQYKPNGMWFDWYWNEGATKATETWFKQHHPDVRVTFNFSNIAPRSYSRIDITSSETHSYDGPFIKYRKEQSMSAPVFTSAVKWANVFRATFTHQWETCTPAGKWWQDQTLRDDPNELLRLAAMILANGGKLCIGATAQMEGSIFPDQLKQLKMLGAWYKPRKEYFINAAAIRYRGLSPSGVKVTGQKYDVVASAYEQGNIIHLVNPNSTQAATEITLSGQYAAVKEAMLLPQNMPLTIKREGNKAVIQLSAEQIDAIDTLIYLKM